ncbi:MAG: murein biosynthesis integral membrane protein MurJ [Vicinamibacterales bacterium]
MPTGRRSTRPCAGPLAAPSSPSSSSSTIARSAASAGAATMASRVLGLVRDQVLAFYFGAGDAMDAYRVGFKIPNLLRDLFAEGAMSAAFVPTFTRHVAESGRDAAWRLGSLVINALLVVTLALVALGVFFADDIVRALAGDYASVPGKLELTTLLARIMLPTLTVIALAAALMGMLNSLRHFFIPALSPAMFNVVTIVMALAFVPLAPRLGIEQPILIIGASVVLGGAAQLALQWPTLRREGFRYRPLLAWSDPGLRRVLVLMGPGTIGLAATQVNLLVNMFLATREGTGAVSWLDYAFRLMYLPIGLFGVSIATAVLPAVSRHVVDKDQAGSRDTIASGLALMMMMNIPAMVGLSVLAVPIVRVIFEHGRFTAMDTANTAAALQYYAIGLIGYSVVRIASPTFYALGRSRTPVTVSMITVVVNASLNVALVQVLGFRGLALGTSIAAIFNATVLMILLRGHLGGINGGRLASSFVRITLASAVMGAAAIACDRLLTAWLPGDSVALQALRLAVTIGAALLVLAGAAAALRVREFHEGFALVARRLRRRA